MTYILTACDRYAVHSPTLVDTLTARDSTSGTSGRERDTVSYSRSRTHTPVKPGRGRDRSLQVVYTTLNIERVHVCDLPAHTCG